MNEIEQKYGTSLKLLGRDMRKAFKGGINRANARFLVDAMQQLQQLRIACESRRRSANGTEPTSMVEFLAENFLCLEKSFQTPFKTFIKGDPTAAWAASICGVGPTFATYLVAYIDIEFAPTPSSVWRFAGYDPTAKWGKGEKRPYCHNLKVICWRISDSFVKVSNNPKSFYGKVYRQTKELYTEQNGAKTYAAKAKAMLDSKKGYSKENKALLEKGFLPPFLIDLRARRRAVKLFLAHYWAREYERFYRKQAPEPWIIAHGGHADYVTWRDVVAFEKGETT